ncbi:hypothetical protein C2E25_06895 [Geothermobacter hydrogeniphilus]|uniref:N-formylglutamate amidohydrolase n=1 Tax=Geothermobacter hydrogeniphilus TaxID=1969733 RepID=A0A2K2HAZ9_9BACT|nr:N-formylglutamate amidohydrolase [Geothermobacter hydrogeniphilus]PNU20441.1 hypothetical protein C2E25_06895 [Geothermobacter hydrogeniphilus]
MPHDLKYRCCPELVPVSPGVTVAAPPIRLAEALRHLRHRTPFSASTVDGICAVRINTYLPLVCVALHDGAAFPADLEEECLLSATERRFEEDPHTARLLENLPLVLSGLESRYFYDLNRAEPYATANEIFGRKVWRNGHHPNRCRAIARHRRFYQLAGTLIEQLIARYGSCLVLDLHSYNGSKIPRETPLFNLGTCSVDVTAHRRLLDYFLARLAGISLPGLTTNVAENDVFEGRGRFINWVSRSWPQALTLCLEIKKVYCDEHSGALHPEIFPALQEGLTRTIDEIFTAYRESCLQPFCPQAAHL